MAGLSTGRKRRCTGGDRTGQGVVQLCWKQMGTEWGRAWRSGGAQAETERGEYILSVRLNQAAGFIIYRLKFIFRPGKRRRLNCQDVYLGA